MGGYLATITSADENQFLLSSFFTERDSNFAWIGGSEPGDDGVWRWVDGPEAGIQFFYIKTPTAPYNYANWGGIEPNDNKPFEDYAMFNLGNHFSGINAGQWADASPVTSTLDPVIGYLVEYNPAPVPEPNTLSLLSLGMYLLMFRRKRI